jgi:hypothetical protein
MTFRGAIIEEGTGVREQGTDDASAALREVLHRVKEEWGVGR